MGELDGKVAVITGAGSGMARASARVFVREGAKVLGADISGREKETADEIGEPFVPAGHGFWAKLEGFNPGGMKDRPALHMVATAAARGELAPGAAIIESTSGTFGLGLALAGIVHGHPVTLVSDPGPTSGTPQPSSLP